MCDLASIFCLTLLYHLYMIRREMKKASESNDLWKNAGPWSFVGLTMAWRSLLTEIPAEGSIPSSSTTYLAPRPYLVTAERVFVLGMSQGQGLHPLSFWLYWPEESKAKMTCIRCQHQE